MPIGIVQTKTTPVMKNKNRPEDELRSGLLLVLTICRVSGNARDSTMGHAATSLPARSAAPQYAGYGPTITQIWLPYIHQCTVHGIWSHHHTDLATIYVYTNTQYTGYGPIITQTWLLYVYTPIME